MKRKLLLVAVAALAIAGCKDKPKYSGLFSHRYDPDMTGSWTSTMNLNNGAGSATLSFTMSQRDIHLRGVYEQDNPCGESANCTPPIGVLRFGEEGDVTGVTTGQTIEFTMRPRDPTCQGLVEASGLPTAAGFSVSVSGTDCDGTPFRGQGELVRP